MSRFVEYFTGGSASSKRFEQVWREAEKQWTVEHQGPKLGCQERGGCCERGVAWLRKECYREDWSEGKDYEECREAGIDSFPTLRFLRGISSVSGGQTFKGEQTVPAILA
eukprot:CAMPEP_0168461968 /NCGR_PEP_ID=MMETSP0228-20121227/54271_1 /TAXON_ID=133427 /ORGANISM="Protoceratium reticulatum, Strain CCCM 535 (=CCMP 1889)" /LENGTH=109 /DNA_ID=CAMNT_0008477325 /DNA_START=44 /DNA_END=370 /DNA_ORIENTATION=+